MDQVPLVQQNPEGLRQRRQLRIITLLLVVDTVLIAAGVFLLIIKL